VCHDATSKTLEETTDIGTLLHGDDSELVLLVDPSAESLLLVVVDPPDLGPVPLNAGCDQVLVTRNKEEVVVDQLSTDQLRLPCPGEGSLFQQSHHHFGNGLLHEMYLKPLLLSDSGIRQCRRG